MAGRNDLSYLTLRSESKLVLQSKSDDLLPGFRKKHIFLYFKMSKVMLI
jgi:hypothetical protein